MNTATAIRHANQVLKLAGVQEVPDSLGFLEFSYLAAEAGKQLSTSQRAALRFDFKDWAIALRKLHDDFEVIVAADPMIQYRPANRAAKEFHSSNAYVRYFRAGNRTSKTQSGYAEHYLVTTGQHQWRSFKPPPAASFIVGVDYQHYAPKVFETKFITGEPDNPLSPMFPESGKWLHHYDSRARVITVACRNCAEIGKAVTCPHPKSTITLFSDAGDYKALMGGQYILGHFDEHIDELYFSEAQQRTKTVTGGCLIVTGTPLYGPNAWEQRLLDEVFVSGPPKNLIDPQNPKSAPFVSVHTIDQFEAGLVPHHIIRGDLERFDEYEIESRIYGRPSTMAKNPVFNRKKLAAMAKVKPERGQLHLLSSGPKELAKEPASWTVNSKFNFSKATDGELRVWQPPETGAVYVIAVDTAAGLIERDASCASVLRVGRRGPNPTADLVAQWHGWANPFDYATEVFKLALHYNSAKVVVELTGGFGNSVMLKLKKELHYWNLYRETNDPSVVNFNLDARVGVDTNAYTKPRMIAALQYFIKEDLINIPCEATLLEMSAFEQELTGSGGAALSTPRYRGTKGWHDDRVMSLAIGAWVISAHPNLLHQVDYSSKMKGVDKSNLTDLQQLLLELDKRQEKDPFDEY